MKKLTIKNKSVDTSLVVIFVIIILAAAAYFIFYNPNKDVVFEINGKKYTQSQVDSIISYAYNRHFGTKEALSQDAYNYLRTETAAKQLDIMPSPQALNSYLKANYPSAPLNQWNVLVSNDRLIDNSIINNTFGEYAGYSYVFWFGQHIAYGPLYTPPDLGNKTLIAQNQSYASSQASTYYKELKDGTISPAQALTNIQSDANLDLYPNGSASSSPSTYFSNSGGVSWADKVSYLDIINYIKSQHTLGLSTIKTGYIRDASTGTVKSPGFYYIVLLQKVSNSKLQSPNDFQSYVDSINAKYYGWGSV
ncbi:MAG TPA: hypothetical protein VL989_01805 [Candidatus Sulfotelmatobacter sp.]|nr:hypothetical protein [Candidatus Sulfotelmatobacter sp.]